LKNQSLKPLNQRREKLKPYFDRLPSPAQELAFLSKVEAGAFKKFNLSQAELYLLLSFKMDQGTEAHPSGNKIKEYFDSAIEETLNQIAESNLFLKMAFMKFKQDPDRYYLETTLD
jgi:hypothetical protein